MCKPTSAVIVGRQATGRTRAFGAAGPAASSIRTPAAARRNGSTNNEALFCAVGCLQLRRPRSIRWGFIGVELDGLGDSNLSEYQYGDVLVHTRSGSSCWRVARWSRSRVVRRRRCPAEWEPPVAAHLGGQPEARHGGAAPAALLLAVRPRGERAHRGARGGPDGERLPALRPHGGRGAGQGALRQPDPRAAGPRARAHEDPVPGARLAPALQLPARAQHLPPECVPRRGGRLSASGLASFDLSTGARIA